MRPLFSERAGQMVFNFQQFCRGKYQLAIRAAGVNV
jgi:hypothetical protein